MATAEPGSFVDSAADVIAIIVILVVPCAAIALFWMVHVLPEKIAERRHHPQQEAIKVLCLLSLVFGGLLWPLAWLWAYSKPVLHKLSYGTDKHDAYYTDATDEPVSADELRRRVAELRRELDVLSRRNEVLESRSMERRVAQEEPSIDTQPSSGAPR